MSPRSGEVADDAFGQVFRPERAYVAEQPRLSLRAGGRDEAGGVDTGRDGDQRRQWLAARGSGFLQRLRAAFAAIDFRLNALDGGGNPDRFIGEDL